MLRKLSVGALFLLTTLTVLLLLFIAGSLNSNVYAVSSTYLEYGGTHSYGPNTCANTTYTQTSTYFSANFPPATKKIIGILSNNSLGNGSGAGSLRTLNYASNSLNNFGYSQINDTYSTGPFLNKKYCHIDTGLNAANYGFSSFTELCNYYGYASTPYISNLRDYWTQDEFTVTSDGRSMYCNYPTMSPKGEWTGSFEYYFLIENVPLNITIDRKVMAIIFDPDVDGAGGTPGLWEYIGWNNPTTLASQLIYQLGTNSHNKVSYSIPAGNLVTYRVFPQKTDGFTYTATSYLDCLANPSTCNSNNADYLKILNDYNVCGKLNSGEIDELWMFGGPYMGFWESNMAGPNAFWYNSGVTTGSTCNKLLPIMGFSYERDLTAMIHNYGHRLEATLGKVYYDNPNQVPWPPIANNEGNFFASHYWTGSTGEPFTNSYYGCGTTHFAPNSLVNGIFDSTTYVDSICNAFYSYPNLGDPNIVKQSINCSAWGCSGNPELNYYNWSQNHLPWVNGVGPDGKLNNWWQYLINPNNVLSLSQAQVQLLINSFATSLTVPIGTPFTLNWRSELAADCTATNAWTGTKDAAGALSLQPGEGYYTYTLTCGNSPPTSVTVTVQ